MADSADTGRPEWLFIMRHAQAARPHERIAGPQPRARRLWHRPQRPAEVLTPPGRSEAREAGGTLAGVLDDLRRAGYPVEITHFWHEHTDAAYATALEFRSAYEQTADAIKTEYGQGPPPLAGMQDIGRDPSAYASDPSRLANAHRATHPGRSRARSRERRGAYHRPRSRHGLPADHIAKTQRAQNPTLPRRPRSDTSRVDSPEVGQKILAADVGADPGRVQRHLRDKSEDQIEDGQRKGLRRIRHRRVDVCHFPVRHDSAQDNVLGRRSRGLIDGSRSSDTALPDDPLLVRSPAHAFKIL